MVILSLNTIDSSEAYKQIPIYRIINPDRSLKVCRGLLFVYCIAIMPLRTVGDAGLYKENLNFLMRSLPCCTSFLLFPRLDGGHAEMLLELSVEGGVVAKAAFRGNHRCLLALLKKSSRKQQTLQDDVSPKRRARGFLKDAIEIGFAEEEFLLQHVKALNGGQIFVDIVQKLANDRRRAAKHGVVLEKCLVKHSLFFRAKHFEQDGSQISRKASQIGNRIVILTDALQAFADNIKRFIPKKIQIVFAERSVTKDLVEQLLFRGENLLGKVDGDSVIGRERTWMRGVDLTLLHDQKHSGAEGVIRALDGVIAASLDQKVQLEAIVRMQMKSCHVGYLRDRVVDVQQVIFVEKLLHILLLLRGVDSIIPHLC